MSQRLKSWESPRHRGRNNKGKGGAARFRQVKKQQQTLRKLLKAQNTQKNENRGSHFSFLYPLTDAETTFFPLTKIYKSQI
jgi:hypothetical protein